MRYALRASAVRRQDKLHAQLDRFALDADRLVRAAWKEIVAVLAGPHPHGAINAVHRIKAVLRRLAGDVDTLLSHKLTTVGADAHARETADMEKHLPDRVIAHVQSKGFREAAAPKPQGKVFAPPSQQKIQDVVRGSGWQRRLATLTGLATPATVARIVRQGFAAGQTPQQMTRDLLPHVSGIQTAAKRIIRTEGMRVAHTMQMDAYAQLGDLVVAYQVRAVLDKNTRPEHRARDKKLYYANPPQGRDGYDKMPRPPMEADGSYAFNCRCYLVPVLRDLASVPSPTTTQPTAVTTGLPPTPPPPPPQPVPPPAKTYPPPLVMTPAQDAAANAGALWALAALHANPALPPEARPVLTRDERESVWRYTGSEYRAINNQLWSGMGFTPVARTLQQSIVRQPPLPVPVDVVRVINCRTQKDLDDFLQKMRDAGTAGVPVEFAGFTSASTNTNGAFPGQVLMHIKASQGMDVSRYGQHPHEAELLLPAMTKFRVVRIDDQRSAGGGKIHVWLEQIVV